MIVTLTAHPSLDRTVALEHPLQPGEVQQAVAVREDAGGKGVNVARALYAAGADVLAVLPLSPDDSYGAALRATGVPAREVRVTGRVRANIALTDTAGTTTKINLPGVRLGSAEREALIAGTVAASMTARWLVLAGSLPPGAGDDFYVDVIAAVRAAGSTARIAVDTSGAGLAAVVADGHADLIKPNDDELAELTGGGTDEGDLIADVARAARKLVPGSVGSALVTLGRQGAVLVTAHAAWHAAAPRVAAVSTVGAGDSSLAGFLLAEAAGASHEACLENAVRYGAAAAALPGTQIPTPDDLPAGGVALTSLAVERPDPAGIAP